MTDPASVDVPTSVHPSADDLDLEPADPVPAVARPGERERVADEQQPVDRLQPRDERPQRRVDVVAVGDELDERVVVEQRRDRDARARGDRRRSSR